MADVESNINVNIDTSNALAAIKRLQSQISAFHTSMARGGAQAAATSSQLQKELVNSLNATGNFSAGFRNVKSSADAFTTSLEKNKFSLGEYFRYAGASTKTFGKVFQTEMATIDKVARERVKDLQTQYIKLGTEANGAIKTIAIRPLTLDLQDLGTKTAIAAQKQQLFNELMRQGSTNLLNFGKNTQWAGRQLMVGFSIPLGIAGAAAAREFMKLEEQAIRFKRVYGDTFTPSGETDRMVEDVKKLADAYTTYGIAVEKTMGLAADAAAMGKTGADLLAQVDQASKLAVLGNVDQQEALKTTISLTSAFGTATRDLAKDINFLNAVENQTVTSIEDLTTAIPTAAPVIQQLGGDVQDLTFFLTAMREGGINASEGANALKSGLASMINPTTAATEMLGKFGVNLQGIVDGNKGNVKQMIVDLGLALDGLDPTNRAQAIEQLFGKFQFARMSTLFQNVIKEGSQAGRVLELTARSAVELSLLSEREMKKVADSPMFKFQAALEKFQTALAPVGEAFLKLITPIIEWGKQLLDGFNSWGDGAKNFTMLLVGAVAGLGPILLMGFGLIANGAANLIKGLMGLFNFFKRLGGQSKILGEQTKYMSQEQINAMAAAASLEQAHNSLTQAFTSEKAAIRQLITAYEQASVAQSRFMSAPVNRGTVGKTTPVKKASGGIISGPGTGTSDSIPAMLSNGEAVIPAKQVAANRGLVEGLIAGNMPAYAKGGIVGPKRKLNKYDPKTGAIRYSSADKVEQSMSDSIFGAYKAAKQSGNMIEANALYRQAEMYLRLKKSGKNKINYLSEEEELQIYNTYVAQIEQQKIAKNKRFFGLGRFFAKGGIVENIPGYAKGGIVGNPLQEIFKRFKKSKKSKMPVTDFGELISPSKGHSFPDFESNPYGNKAMGGLYRKPDGSLVFVKPQMDERGAVAELRATQIAREAHGLKTPQQSLRVMKDPNDEKGQRKVFALESPFDEALANPTGTFTKEEMGKQLVASLLRGDKDLSQSNMYSNVLADVGTAGVFDRASGFRDFAPQMPTMEEQANINLLAIRGGAKRAFAESTADIARSMTPQQYNDMIVSEIDTVLPKLQQTIASFGLTDPQEIAAYQRMVDRLREGRSVDWSRFHGIHSAVQPKPQKLARGTARVTKKPVARGYDFDDTLVNLSSFLPGHREANAKLPKEQRKSWGWEAIKGAAPMPKVVQNLLDSQAAGKKIIIMTARPNTMDPMTTAHLKALGINPKNVKLISRDIADKSLSGLSTAELKAVQAKNVMDEYDLEAFFDDMEDNRNAVAGLGVNVFDPLKFASGSHMVPGTGNRDTVPALLTPGEAVIPKAQAEKYRPLIRGMIAGNLPGYQLGTDNVVDTSGMIDRIVGNAAARSQDALRERLSKGLNKAIALGVEDAFDAALKDFEASEINPTDAKLKKFFTENNLELGRQVIAPQLGQQNRTSEAHIGETVSMSAEQARQSAINPTKGQLAMFDAQEQAEKMGLPSKLLAEGSFHFDTLMSLNRLLFEGNAPIDEILTDWDSRGIEKWRKTFQKAGESIDDPEFNQALKEYDAKVRAKIAQLKQTQTTIGDADISRINREVMDATPDGKLKTTISKLENTIGGFRSAQPKSTRDTLSAVSPENAAMVKSATSGKSANTIRGGNIAGPLFTGLAAGEYFDSTQRIRFKEAGKKAVQEQADAFNEGAKEKGGVASPAKETKKTGAAHSEGFIEGSKEGIAKAKTVGEAIAERNVNTNPAFGRVPQVAPVASASMRAFVEQQTKGMMKSGAIATLLASASPIQKLNGDFSIMTTNIKNMSAQLQLARSPITMLQNAATSAKNGLVTAAESVKDFGIKAASGAKAFGEASVRAATQFGQAAKQMVVNAPGNINNWYNGGGPEEITDEYGNKTKQYKGMRGKIIEGGNKFGGKVAGAGMGIGMAAMMAQSMGGPVGDIAGQLSGPIMAISSIASIFQMFPGILAAMTGPVGLVVAGLAAVGVGLYMMYDHLIKTREAAKAAAEATAISTTNTQKMAEASGTISASEIMQRQRKQGAAANINPELTWGEQQLESDFGQNLKAQLEQSVKAVGKGQASQEFANQLGTYVATGIMDQAQAVDLATALGASMGDNGLAFDVIGKMKTLIGPDGKDVLKNGITAAMNLTTGTSKTLGASISKIQNTGFAMWGSKEWDAMVASEQQAAVGFTSLVTQSQMLVDSLDVEHQRRLENLIAAGDMAGITAENAKYETDRKSLIEDNTKKINEQLEAYKKLPKANQNAILQSSKDSLTTQYKGTEQEAAANAVTDTLDAKKTTYGSRGGSVTKQLLTNEQQLVISTNVQAGNIDVAAFQKLSEFMKPETGNNAAVYTAIADVSANVSGAAGGQLTQLLSNFGPGNEEAAIKISTEISNLNPEEAEATLTAYTALQDMGEDGVNLVIAAQTDPSAEKKLKSYTDRYKKIQDLTANGPITMQMVIDSDPEGFAALEGQTEYFNSLPAAQQRIFLERYLTVRETVTGDEAMRYLKENNVERKGGYAGSVQQYSESQMNEARGALAAQGAQEFMQGLGDVGGDTGDGYGGGGGGGSSEPPPRTIADVIADQKKRIESIGNQTAAVKKLTAAGLSLADAYAIAADAEDAALIANGANAEQLAELAAKTREAEKATKDLAAATNVASSALDIKEKNDLAAKLAADKTITDIQKRFLLENADAARLYMNPTFDPAALKQALIDAQNASTYEFNINKVTIPGLQDIWKKGMSNAAEAFSAQQNVIELNFKVQKDPFEDIIQAGQRAIQDIQNRPGGLDDLDADLQRIADKEFAINKAYDDKAKALDEVSRINDRIISQQKSQLGLANALSTGDIAAAARAAQDMQAQGSLNSIADQKTALEEARKAEIEGLTGRGGLTREQIEERVRDLKAQILEIEEQRIEPAQRQMELLDRMQQDQIDALVVLGKTKDEWDAINTSLELANTNTFEFQESMRQALSIATQLGAALAGATVQSVYIPPPTPPPPPLPPAPAARSRAWLEAMAARVWAGEFGNGQARRNALGADYDAIQRVVDGYSKGGMVSYMKKGGMLSYMNAGGMVPYMAMGGIASALARGTDTIPAMLTAGEFVMSKPAVDKLGAGRLAELNRGYDRNSNNRSDSVYNYNISVNASTNANPREIAQTVLAQIKQVDAQRIRSNRF